MSARTGQRTDRLLERCPQSLSRFAVWPHHEARPTRTVHPAAQLKPCLIFSWKTADRAVLVFRDSGGRFRLSDTLPLPFMRLLRCAVKMGMASVQLCCMCLQEGGAQSASHLESWTSGQFWVPQSPPLRPLLLPLCKTHLHNFSRPWALRQFSTKEPEIQFRRQPPKGERGLK